MPAKAKTSAAFATVTERTLADWRAARRRLLESGATASAVHDWRICTRRLLALEALLVKRNEVDAGPCAMRLHDAFRASGKLRDTQVAIRLLESLPTGERPAVRIIRQLQGKLPASRRRVVREVSLVRTRELRALAAKWDVRVQSAHAPPPGARRRIAAELRALKKESARSGSQEALHQQRLRIKRLRYLLELCGETDGLPALIRWQSELGAITDTFVTLEQVVRACGKNSRPEECDALQRQLLRRYKQLLRRQSRRTFRYKFP